MCLSSADAVVDFRLNSLKCLLQMCAERAAAAARAAGRTCALARHRLTQHMSILPSPHCLSQLPHSPSPSPSLSLPLPPSPSLSLPLPPSPPPFSLFPLFSFSIFLCSSFPVCQQSGNFNGGKSVLPKTPLELVEM